MDESREDSLSADFSDEYMVDFDELEFIEKINEGALSDIYYAEYRGQPVAVKIFDKSSIDRERLRKEFRMLRSLRSPNIVFFFGLTVTPKLSVVMEYCELGTLADVLANNLTSFTWKLFFKIGKALILTLRVLHSARPPIIHREIKPRTLLMSDGYKMKLADFGRARFTEEGDAVMKTYSLDANLTNVAYTAPEVYVDGEFSMKTDVYSVGMVLWELAARIISGRAQKPYHEQVKAGKNGFQVLRMTSMQALRPSLEGFPEELAELISSCWQPVAEDRPSAIELCGAFASLEKTYHRRGEKCKWPIGKESVLDDFAEEPITQSPTVERHMRSSPTHSAEDMERLLEEKELVYKRITKETKKLRKLQRRLKQDEKRKALEGKKDVGVPTFSVADVVVSDILGKGGFGEVWKAKLAGADVAVKKLLKTAMQKDVQKAFLRELHNMLPLRHPNLVQLMAVIDGGDNLMLVMEHLPGGNVGTLPKDTPFPVRMRIARDVVRGMAWLHSLTPQPLLHLDLKPANILLDGHMNAKIADFGLSGFKKDMNKLDTIGGSPFYMAPEVLDGSDFDEKADVYSFAMVLWVLYGKKPIEMLYKERFSTLDQLTDAICDEVVRPPVGGDCPPFLMALLEQCWHPKPRKRPSFMKILEDERLEKIIQQAAMGDDGAVEFWSTYFGGQEQVEWDDFFECMVSHLDIPVQDVPLPKDGLYVGLRECLVHPREKTVRQPQFARFLRYFGPWDESMMQRVQDNALHKSFHGDITKKAAEEMLRTRKKNRYYLVRYGAKPGDYIITVVRKKARHLVFYNFVVRNVCGSFVFCGRDVDVLADADLDEEKRYDSIPLLIRRNRKHMHIASASKFVPPRGRASLYVPDMDPHKLSST